jgi:acyl-[acyl-carrier-protein] desaturase
LVALNRVLQNFEMPGTMIPGFGRRALAMARLGVYNLRIHAENVIDPLVRHWKVDEITGLSPEGAEAQEAILAIVPDLLERAEQFERRQARKTRKKTPAAVA